jgi:hypothetical protein
MRKIKNTKELLANIRAGKHNYFIALAGGAVRSSKYIGYNEKTKKFVVDNFVDDTRQNLTEEGLFESSNIGEAINKGCLIME